MPHLVVLGHICFLKASVEMVGVSKLNFHCMGASVDSIIDKLGARKRSRPQPNPFGAIKCGRQNKSTSASAKHWIPDGSVAMVTYSLRGSQFLVMNGIFTGKVLHRRWWLAR